MESLWCLKKGDIFEKDKDEEKNKCILDNTEQILKPFSYAISQLWLWQRW